MSERHIVLPFFLLFFCIFFCSFFCIFFFFFSSTFAFGVVAVIAAAAVLPTNQELPKAVQ